MSFFERLKSESGHNNDLLIVVTILAIIAAIAIPEILLYTDKSRSLDCLTALARIANQEIDMEEASCPIPFSILESEESSSSASNPSLARETVDGVERYFISDSQAWFPTSPLFLWNEGNLTFEQSFPENDVEPDKKGRLKRGWVNRVRIQNIREGTLIKTEITLWGLVVMLLVGIFLLILIGGAIIEDEAGCLLGLLILFGGLLFLAADLITSESILVDPAGRQVKIQTVYLGLFEGEPHVLSHPMALVPAQYGNRATVMLLYKEEGGLRATHLFDLDVDQLGGLAAVEAVLQGSEGDETEVIDGSTRR